MIQKNAWFEEFQKNISDLIARSPAADIERNVKAVIAEQRIAPGIIHGGCGAGEKRQQHDQGKGFHVDSTDLAQRDLEPLRIIS